MKNIIVISDTHGNKKAIDSIGRKLTEADCVFHLGDIMQDAEYVRKRYNLNVFSVLGNCDFDESEEIVQIEDVKFLLCHGHKYSVKAGLEKLHLEGLRKKVDVCLFGHTHEARIENYDDVTLINPGAMSSEYFSMSYCYITVVGSKFFSKIVSL